jgi:hypothetical protein
METLNLLVLKTVLILGVGKAACGAAREAIDCLDGLGKTCRLCAGIPATRLRHRATLILTIIFFTRTPHLQSPVKALDFETTKEPTD